MRSEAAQLVEHGLGLESAARTGKSHERLRVERHLELCLKSAGKQRVQEGSAKKFEFEIFAVLAKLHSLQQNRRDVCTQSEGPAGQPHPHGNGVDSAHGSKFGVL